MTDTTMSTTAMDDRKRARLMGLTFLVFGLLLLGVILILGMDIVGK